MSYRDDRLPPFAWMGLDAIDYIRAETDSRGTALTLALYAGLCYLAARKHGQGGRDGFAASRSEVAAVCGLSTGSVHKYATHLEAIGMLTKDERTEGGRTLSPVWVLGGVPSGDTLSRGEREVTPLPRGRASAGETKNLRNEDDRSPQPPEGEDTFEDWLEHHIAVTGNRAGATPDTKARRKVESAWRERRKEYPDLDLRLVSLGAQADQHRRENGYTDAESVLRPSAVQKLAAKAERGDPRRSGAGADFEWDGDALAERTRREAAERQAAGTGNDDGPEVGF